MEKPVISFSQREDPIEKRLSTLERELLLLKHRVRKLEETVRSIAGMEEEEEENVLLREIDVSNPRVIEIVMDWVGFMLSKVGDEELPTLLEYYRSIGWISKKVKELLLKYAQGLRVEEVKGFMDPEDHIKSLEYINRIREAMG